MKQLTEEQRLDLLIQCGIAKLFNDNCSYLFGELKGEQSHWFKVSVSANTNLIKSIESRMLEGNKETLECLLFDMNEGIAEMRKTILNDLKK